MNGGVFGARRLLTLDSTKSLAVALKQNPAHVEPVWIRAKETMDRAVADQQRATESRVASWPEIQLPSLALRNLLEAQTKSVDRLPYELLSVHEPPLSTVYVSPRIQIRTSDERTSQDDSPGSEPLVKELPTSRRTQAVTSISEALDNHDHLVVTGEPGAGKSTMSSYLARQLSRLWLREDSMIDPPVTEPLVPLRVSARSLVGSGSWSSVLARAASRSFGRSLLEDPDPGLFAGRVHGARWLVMVDGLDEIPDPRLRGEVVWAIGQHARVGSDYRFVVTTRALPDAELAPFSAMGSYVIQPFDRPQLEEFARKWFNAQRVSSAAAETERFLRETSDGRLRELVRNPLLATIAAVSAVKEPERPLPASRISLYERFCDYLSGDRVSRRNPLDQLHKQHEHDPERFGCVRWLHRSRASILDVLARRRLESQDKLWQAAVDWVSDNVAHDVDLVDGWQEHLWEELAGTGLLVASDRELVFLHQSFAEFLAARSHAEALGDEPADLDAWIRRGLREADRTFALFTFAMWAARQGQSIDVVLERLLSSLDPRRVFFAGRLLAEGIPASAATADGVIDRLFALVRNGEDDEASEGFEVLGALFDHAPVIDRLALLARDMDVLTLRRARAVGALERLQGAEPARSLLLTLLPSAYLQLIGCARVAIRLDPETVEAVRQRAHDIVREPDSSPTWRAHAAEALQILGMTSDVAEMARSVLVDRLATAQNLKRAADAWIAVDAPNAKREIAGLANGRPKNDHAGRAELAAVLVKAGAVEEGAELAEGVLNHPDADGDASTDAAEVLVTARGARAVAVVLDATARWLSADRAERIWHAATLLEHVAAYPEAAVVSRVKVLLEARRPAGIGAYRLVDAWLAERVLRSPYRNGRGDYETSAGVLLKADRAAAFEVLAGLIEQGTGPLWLAGVMDALGDDVEPEAEALRARCARKVVECDHLDSQELRNALRVLMHTEGEQALPLLAQAVRTRPELGIVALTELISAVAATGRTELARSLWSHMLDRRGNLGFLDGFMLEDLVGAGEREWAVRRIGEILEQPDVPPRRVLRLKQMLGWLTAQSDLVDPAG